MGIKRQTLKSANGFRKTKQDRTLKFDEKQPVVFSEIEEEYHGHYYRYHSTTLQVWEEGKPMVLVGS